MNAHNEQQQSREAAMVVIQRDAEGKPTVWCDPEIVDLVTALNAGGVPTVASCSGHGEQNGIISLRDGRELIIASDYDTARCYERAIATQPAAAQEAVAWVKAKPTAEGDYYVRGFNLFEPKQYEALVQVRMHHFDGEPAPELVCNLHESTSSEDMDDWSPIVEMSDDFEWRGPLFAAPVTAAPADTWFADQLTAMGEVIPLDSTPAAPGIDLKQFRVPVEFWRDVFRGKEDHDGEPDSRVAEADRLLALIDASPKVAAPALQVPAGWALVPDRMQLTPENMELLADTLRGADEDEPWCGGVLWVGQTTDDDGEPTYYGLNVGNVECLEEGSINIVEFAEVQR